METLIKRFRYRSRGQVYKLWFLSDFHVGNACCDETLLRKTVREIRAEADAWKKADEEKSTDMPVYPPVFTLGDDGEFISRQDWRFRQSQLAPWLRGLECDYCDDLVQAEEDRAVAIQEPIKDLILGKLWGNHEDKQLRAFERNVARNICNRLGVPALQECAYVRLIFARGKNSDVRTLDLFLHHGWFAGRTATAKEGNLLKILADWDVDIAAVGHGHARHVAEPRLFTRLNQEGTALTKRRRYALMTGAFLESHVIGTTNYASQSGYAPSDLGPVTAFFKPIEGRLWVEY
jgi:hypothetical protein